MNVKMFGCDILMTAHFSIEVWSSCFLLGCYRFIQISICDDYLKFNQDSNDKFKPNVISTDTV